MGGEGAFAVGFYEGYVEARVPSRVLGAQDFDSLGGQGRADEVAPRARAVAAGVDDREALAGGGGHDVEAAADRDLGRRGEHVAAAFREGGDAHDYVDECLAREE